MKMIIPLLLKIRKHKLCEIKAKPQGLDQILKLYYSAFEGAYSGLQIMCQERNRKRLIVETKVS